MAFKIEKRLSTQNANLREQTTENPAADAVNTSGTFGADEFGTTRARDLTKLGNTPPLLLQSPVPDIPSAGRWTAWTGTWPPAPPTAATLKDVRQGGVDDCYAVAATLLNTKDGKLPPATFHAEQNAVTFTYSYNLGDNLDREAVQSYLTNPYRAPLALPGPLKINGKSVPVGHTIALFDANGAPITDAARLDALAASGEYGQMQVKVAVTVNNNLPEGTELSNDPYTRLIEKSIAALEGGMEELPIGDSSVWARRMNGRLATMTRFTPGAVTSGTGRTLVSEGGAPAERTAALEKTLKDGLASGASLLLEMNGTQADNAAITVRSSEGAYSADPGSSGSTWNSTSTVRNLLTDIPYGHALLALECGPIPQGYLDALKASLGETKYAEFIKEFGVPPQGVRLRDPTGQAPHYKSGSGRKATTSPLPVDSEACYWYPLSRLAARDKGFDLATVY